MHELTRCSVQRLQRMTFDQVAVALERERVAHYGELRTRLDRCWVKLEAKYGTVAAYRRWVLIRHCWYAWGELYKRGMR